MIGLNDSLPTTSNSGRVERVAWRKFRTMTGIVKGQASMVLCATRSIGGRRGGQKNVLLEQWVETSQRAYHLGHSYSFFDMAIMIRTQAISRIFPNLHVQTGNISSIKKRDEYSARNVPAP